MRLKANYVILAKNLHIHRLIAATVYASRFTYTVQLVLKYTESHQTRVGVVLRKSAQKSKTAIFDKNNKTGR